jgi:hypothetical protein
MTPIVLDPSRTAPAVPAQPAPAVHLPRIPLWRLLGGLFLAGFVILLALTNLSGTLLERDWVAFIAILPQALATAAVVGIWFTIFFFFDAT